MQTLIQKRNQIKNQINRQAVRANTDIDALWQLIHQWTELEHQLNLTMEWDAALPILETIWEEE